MFIKCLSELYMKLFHILRYHCLICKFTVASCKFSRNSVKLRKGRLLVRIDLAEYFSQMLNMAMPGTSTEAYIRHYQISITKFFYEYRWRRFWLFSKKNSIVAVWQGRTLIYTSTCSLTRRWFCWSCRYMWAMNCTLIPSVTTIVFTIT